MAGSDVLELLARIKMDSSDFERGLSNASVQAKSMASTISNNFSAIGKTFQNIGGAISSFGDKIASVGKSASVVTAGITGVLAASFTKAKSFIGTYESAMTVFTRKLEGGETAANDLYKALEGISMKSAYAQEYLISAGQTLVAMGIDAETTAKYVQVATNAVSGFGGTGADIQTMAELFAKISQQTNLYTTDIQQMVRQGIPAWDILATKYHTTTDEVKNMASQGLLPATESLNTITDALNESDEASEMFQYSVAGLADKLSTGTLTGTMDTLNANFRTFALRLLDLDPRTESGKKNIENLNGAIQAFGKVLENIGDKFSFVGGWISAGLQNITDWLNKFNNALENMPQWQAEAIAKTLATIALGGPALLVVGKAISAIGGAISSVGGVFSWLSGIVSGASGAFGTLVGVVGGVGPAFGIVAAAIAGVIGVITFLKDEWNNVTNIIQKTKLGEAFSKVGEAIGQLFNKLGGLHNIFHVIGQVIVTALIPAFALITTTISAIMGVASGLIDAISGVIDIFSGLGSIIRGLVSFDFPMILDGFRQIWDGIVGLFSGLWEAVTAPLSAFVQNMIGWISGLSDAIGLTQWITNTWNSITNFLSNISNSISSFFSSIFSFVSSAFNNILLIISTAFSPITEAFYRIWENCSNTVINIFNNIFSFIQTIWGNISSYFSSVLSNISNMFSTVWENIRNMLSNVFNSIRSASDNVWNGIRNTCSNIWNNMSSMASNAFNNMKNNIVNAWNSLRSAASSVFESIKNAIMNPINNAVSAVQNAINRMKGMFNFSWSLPKLKLPHLRISGEFSLMPPSVPSFGIDWYKKGAILNDPTIFGINPFSDNLMVGGESGPEAIAPIDTLQEYIKEAINENNSTESMNNTLIILKNILSQYLPKLANRQIVLDTGAFIGELSPKIDTELGVITSMKSRGN